MSLNYLHGEQILPFILIVLALEVIGWCAIIYLFYRWWRKRRK
jgi:hypothetical protein